MLIFKRHHLLNSYYWLPCPEEIADFMRYPPDSIFNKKMVTRFFMRSTNFPTIPASQMYMMAKKQNGLFRKNYPSQHLPMPEYYNGWKLTGKKVSLKPDKPSLIIPGFLTQLLRIFIAVSHWTFTPKYFELEKCTHILVVQNHLLHCNSIFF